MRESETHHRSECLQHAGDKLRIVTDKRHVEHVHGAYAESKIRKRCGQFLHKIHVRVQLDLTRAVEEHVVVDGEIAQLLLQPIDVVQ